MYYSVVIVVVVVGNACRKTKKTLAAHKKWFFGNPSLTEKDVCHFFTEVLNTPMTFSVTMHPDNLLF